MDDEDFNRIYQRACEEIDNGDPAYGWSILRLIGDEMVARDIAVPSGGGA